MSEKVISLLRGHLSLMQQRLKENSDKELQAQASLVSGLELADRMFAQEAERVAHDNIQQLLGAITAYQETIKVCAAEVENAKEEPKGKAPKKAS